jgi:hypothetical protein
VTVVEQHNWPGTCSVLLLVVFADLGTLFDIFDDADESMTEPTFHGLLRVFVRSDVLQSVSIVMSRGSQSWEEAR